MGEVGQVRLGHAVLVRRRQRVAVHTPRVRLGAHVARVERRAQRLECRVVRFLELAVGGGQVARGLDDAPLEEVVVLAPVDEELAALQRALSGDQELVHVDGLHDEVVGAKLQARDRGLHIGGARQHDHRHVAVRRANLLEKLDARHTRHLEIGDHELWPPRLEDLYAFAAVVGEQAVVAGRDEDLMKDFAYLTVVIDDQDVPLGHVM